MVKLTKLSHKTFAGFMSIWLSGIVFLFCCEMPGAAAEDFCPLSKAESHCDKIDSGNSPQVLAKSLYSETVDCCAFLPAVFDKFRNLERSRHTAQVAAKISVERPLLSLSGNDSGVSLSYRPPQFGQNRIYIKNRVLRI